MLSGCRSRAGGAAAIAAAFVGLVFAPAVAAADPAGLEMGAPLGRLAHEKTATPGLYRIVPPRRPEAPFETVLVVATPDDGVCAVVLVSPSRTFDSAGAGVRAIFAHVERLISQQYGPSVRTDRLRPGAVLTQPTDFAAALDTGQRELRADWGSRARPLASGNVAALRLEARAVDADATYVRLTYQFRNYARCRASLDALQNARRLLDR